ncbi:hypothetical protein [Sorangium cellulosum]|uniref:Uncharacterized protein n=1 Tax=Sorangium cellulosum So0157-2 TaxID=1254432 RepID=S4XYA5_SORCE|nr:hypothetical protein [Sorangium cellulosum]AGP35588.1 hypothetical protein SCE1572_14250 [Sorangium cellulosum So0157-2]
MVSSTPLLTGGGSVVPNATGCAPADKDAEPPPSVARALTAAAEAQGAERSESWELCGALLALATGWLAWSLPAPNPRDVLLVALCLTLVTLEYRRAGARFRKAIAAAAGARGMTASEAAREARRLDAAFRTARAAGQPAAGADAERR